MAGSLEVNPDVVIGCFSHGPDFAIPDCFYGRRKNLCFTYTIPNNVT